MKNWRRRMQKTAFEVALRELTWLRLTASGPVLVESRRAEGD
jgi:hypothetical protein